MIARDVMNIQYLLIQVDTNSYCLIQVTTKTYTEM